MITLYTLCLLLSPFSDIPAKPTEPLTQKAALQKLQRLVGSWKATGYPDGTREERAKGFWTETVSWEWQFVKQDTWLAVKFDKGKHFQSGELRYNLEKKQYQFKALTINKETLNYTGTVTEGKDGVPHLALTRKVDESTERLTFSLLHDNRHLYKLETSPRDGASFSRKYQVGATKEGEEFAKVPKGPECIVSGGKGTITVTHKGKQYFVCCSGCKDAFYAEPETYIKEFEAKSKK
jgi:YHS domain-containing protein